jgi:hypothetical protein
MHQTRYTDPNGRRVHFVVPLGAGRIDDKLTPASIARLDEGIRIAKRENAFGLVALGDYFSTWRQGEPYNTRGADIRAAYLKERIPKKMHVIKVTRGSDTLQELVALRDVGAEYGVKKMIIVTHPEHIERVQALSEMIFSHPYYLRGQGGPFTVEVESGRLPQGLINITEEEESLKITLEYLARKYPPHGIIPRMTWSELNPPTWMREHAELYASFQRIYQQIHAEGHATDFYVVGEGKERK